jgi:serine protease Do
MTRKKLILALVAAGLAVAATSVALTMYPSFRLGGNDPASTSASAAPAAKPRPLGLTLRHLTQSEKARAARQGGLLIQGVTGAAARAGLVPGEVLLAINGVAVQSVDQVSSAMNKNPDGVELLILRHGEQVFVPVVPG